MNLSERITPEHLAAYESYNLTAAAVAAIYGTTRTWVQQSLKRRRPPPSTPSKAVLLSARRTYRMKLSLTTSAREAAEATFTSLRTMYRYRAKAKILQAEGKL